MSIPSAGASLLGLAVLAIGIGQAARHLQADRVLYRSGNSISGFQCLADRVSRVFWRDPALPGAGLAIDCNSTGDRYVGGVSCRRSRSVEGNLLRAGQVLRSRSLHLLV